MMRLLAMLLLALVGSAGAQERALLCYNYGCLQQVEVGYGPMQLEPVRAALLTAVDPQGEREILAEAVGRLYLWAGTQTPIHADQRGDLADEAVEGRMDCIDHAASTTELLRMVERRGWLRFHRVLPVVRRSRLIFQHFSAAVEEVGEMSPDVPAPRFVIDSWFVAHGEPAVVLPLVEWLDGGGPYVP
jgi:hypothetical protein